MNRLTATRKAMVAVVTGLVVGVLPIRHARAGADPTDVEELIRQGVALRRDGQDQVALPIFRKAHDLAHTPRTAAQLGLVEMALGYRLDAERHLSEALSSPRDPWIRKNRGQLDLALDKLRSLIGEVNISGTPIGAEVVVNGTSVGRFPLSKSVRVPEGTITVEVRAAGYVGTSRSVTVHGGKREDVTVALDATPAPAARTVEARPLLPTTPEPSSDAGSPPGPESLGQSSGVRTAAWVAAGAAVVAAGFGVFETAQWRAKSGEFNDHIGPRQDSPTVTDKPNCETAAPNRGGSGCQQIYDDMVRARTFAIVGYGAAAALAVGSVLLFNFSGPAHDEPGFNTAFHCSLTAGPGLSCARRF